VEAARFDFWPVPEPGAVVGVRFANGERPAAAEGFVEIVSSYVSVALSREALARRALAVEVAQAGERLKADLLAAVSHDLKTPLSTILLTLQSLLRFGEAHDAQARAELLTLAEAETARLAGLVENLLDMSRIDAGAVVVRLGPVSPADLVAGALARERETLARRSIDNRVTDARPLILVDEALAEAALANVLQNAARYAPADSGISIRAVSDERALTLEVLDEGPGFSADGAALFEKFARGVKDDGRPPGLGLGLAIARGFMTAQGGHIEAANRTDRGGAVVRLTFPLAPVEARS
jgi:two-component system sensor histidine kinase KdpD